MQQLPGFFECKKWRQTRSNPKRVLQGAEFSQPEVAMRVRNRIWLFLIAAGLTAGTLPAQQAQQADPSPNAHLVRVRTGSYAGMCIGWCDSETIIEPGSIRRISRSFSEKKKYPKMESKYPIARKDWDELQRSIDAGVLAAFVGRIGCPGCADEPVEWAEVEFSDGTKKSVSCNSGSAPPQIAALIERIKAIGALPKPKANRASALPIAQR